MVVQEVLQRRLEPWRWGVQWLAIGSWQWPNERIIEADLITTWEIAKELKVSHSTIICHLKQIVKVKKLDESVSWANWKSKMPHLEVWSSLTLWNNKWIISQLDYNVLWKVDFLQFLRQLAMTSSVVGSRSSKALSKTKFYQKKVVVTDRWSTAHSTL